MVVLAWDRKQSIVVALDRESLIAELLYQKDAFGVFEQAAMVEMIHQQQFVVLFFQNSVVVLEQLEMVPVVHQCRWGAINSNDMVEVLRMSAKLSQVLVCMVDFGGYASKHVKDRNEQYEQMR